MKLHFTSDWLRAKIESDPDIECDAGLPLLRSAPLKQFVEEELVLDTTERVPAVLHMLVRQVRRRDKLSVAQLADHLRVEELELQKIEREPDYVPAPRTMHQLAEYLGVSAVAVQKLTVGAVKQDDGVVEAAYKFAASSNDLSSLSEAERRSLNDFVKALGKL